MAPRPEIVDYIRQVARANGIDENIALRVAGAEALNVFDPSRPDLGGDERSSFGPFQLHYAGLSRNMPNAGLGDEFTKATGLDARDPSTWKQQIDFALGHAAKHGWGSWMGAQAQGIGDYEGIKNASASAGGSGAATNIPAAAFPYRLYGGATREDAITGLNRQFNDALTRLYNDAPPEVQRELGLNSAYRNKAIQQQLWDKSDKTGRRVAAPGKSRHQFGEAADLYGFGLTKDQVSQATRDWVAQNAQKYGLGFPVEGEPWHIQLMRSQGQAGQNAQALPPQQQGGPGEGASKFGGTGLGTPAAGIAAGVTPEGKPKNPWQDMLKGFGDSAGKSGLFAPQEASALRPRPAAALATASSTPPIDVDAVSVRRQKLAEAMARLNAGSLWG